MRLHHNARSSASYRVRIAAALKGIALDYVRVDMAAREQQGPDYARLNPQRMVPCLELDDGRVIAQSLAIIHYLDGLYPTPSIWPADPVDRAQCESLCLLLACETAPLQAMIVQRRLREVYGQGDAQVADWLQVWIHRGLAPVETFLAARRRPTRFGFGESPGALEAFVVPQLRNCARFGVDVSAFPTLLALNEAALADPKVAQAHPDLWE